MADDQYLLQRKMAPDYTGAILLLIDKSIYLQGSAGPVRTFTPG